MEKANKVIRISTSLDKDFFRMWVEFLTPLHNLTEREKDIVAALLKERFYLSQSITNDTLMKRLLLGEDSMKRVKEECNISKGFLSVLISRFKKRGIIVNGDINQKLIPKRLSPEDKTFKLMMYFDLNG
jgi:hypothetical protein